jgi:hypothetical protein
MHHIGAHEKDMFLVISTPVLEAMLTVWEVTEGDMIIRKIIESLWGFTSICIGFNLKNILNNLIQILVKKIFKNLNKSQNISSPSPGFEPKEDYVRLNNSKYLLSLDFILLIDRNVKNTEIINKNNSPENDDYFNEKNNYDNSNGDNDMNDKCDGKNGDYNRGNSSKSNIGIYIYKCVFVFIYLYTYIYIYIYISLYIVYIYKHMHIYIHE